MSCGRQLHWHDMIPVASWLALRGRCRACGSGISVQYPLVEAATAILFGFIGFAPHFDIAHKILFCIIAALLVCITVYDFRHTIIPDGWAYAFAGLAFISQFSGPLSGEFNLWWLILAGPIAAAPLFAIWLFSRGAWMGLGDVKLALGIGWLLGPSLGLMAVFFAFVIGALVSVCVLLPLPYILSVLHTLGITSKQIRRGGFTMKSEIPFGPFLIFSCIILWLSIIYGINPLQALPRL